MGFTKLSAAAAIAFLASVALPRHVKANTGAWHFDTQRTLLLARLDPIVAVNKAAGHMHRIWGGNNFAAAYSYDHSRKGNCSTVYAQADLSNYWVPELYATEKDATSATNTYQAVPSDHRFYYFLDRAESHIPVSAFPEGLKMIVGNMSAKTYVETGLPATALRYYCQTPGRVDLTVVSDNFNFDKPCPEIKTEIKFPSCWDGKNLWLSNMSHMAYPQRILYGPCPFSHPIRLPGIMIENTWKTQDTLVDGSPFKNRLIWAHGDTTGFGFHADFTNGWNTEILTKALNDPQCLQNKSIAAEFCPSLGINLVEDIAAAKACRPLNGFVNETGGLDKQIMDSLPGCNLPWSSGAKPKCTDTDVLPDINAFLGIGPGMDMIPDDRTAAPAAQPRNTWEAIGCMDGYVFDLGNKTMWHDWNVMTNNNCHDFCAQNGFPYAATTLGYQCMCGKNMNTASYHNNDDKCGTDCTGDDKNCGGDGFYNTYYNSAVALIGPKQPKESDKSYLGCFMSGTIHGNLSPEPKNIDTCRAHCKGSKYFALNNGRYCNCADSFTDPEALEIRVAESSCQAKCESNSAQICGGNVQGTYYDSVYLVDGTFDAGNAVGTATTVSSEVPILTATAGDLKAIKTGNENLVVVTGTALPTASTVSSSAMSQGTPLAAVNKLAGAMPPIATATLSATPASDRTVIETPATKSSSGSEDCEMEMVTVTVTVTAKPNASKRHLARRSRQHMLANFD